MENKEEIIKWGVVLVLVLIAGYLVYSYSQSFDISKSLREGKKQASYEESLNSLSNSPRVCIVELLDKNEEQRRRNIMNCGVNFASTLPLYGKKLDVYVIENNVCYYTEGEKGVKDCFNEIKDKGCFVIEIKGKGEVETYNNMISIPVGDDFSIDKDCKIFEG